MTREITHPQGATPFKLDSNFAVSLREAGALAARLETLGYDGMWTTETPHDPFLPLLAAGETTSRLSIGTGIATAFTRSPMVLALTAWDLARLSGGRFILGLGTQVKAHNARRYSTPAERPGAQLREVVAALRHIWGAFQGEHSLDFHGDFYTLDLFTPMHSPGAIDDPQIPIYLAAVGPFTYRLAGEVADGVHVHSFHTERYLREVSLPALEQGLRRSGRDRSAVQLGCSLFAVIGGDERMNRAVRSQIAFYGSTGSYRRIFELHGWGELTDRLKPLVRSGDLEAMVAAIDDEVVETFAVVAPTWQDAAEQVRVRYHGLLDRVSFYGLQGMVSPENAPAIAAAFGRG
jgi:probable F420-dependent oxidoreductase